MKSIKAKMLDVNEQGELIIKTTYLEVEKISSFFIEEPEQIEDKIVKCYGITCDGAYYSIIPEPHVYQIIFERFIKNAIKIEKK